MGDLGRKQICKGVESRQRYSPGHEFWKSVRLNKLTKEVREKLNMKQWEINLAYKVALGFKRNKGGKNKDC